MGFGEIQFDYIRFPEPYPSLPQQVFPDNHGVATTASSAETQRGQNWEPEFVRSSMSASSAGRAGR